MACDLPSGFALAPTYHAMLFFRFISGLPHGAYFGGAALVASTLVPENRRMAAVGRVFLGLTCATIVGVPLANWLGQAVGWRWSLRLVAVLGLLAMIMVRLFAPLALATTDASPLRELGALRRPQVWLTLGIGAIGFGGLFAVYTYLADIPGAVTHVAVAQVPLVLAMFGIGLTIGNIVVPMFAGRAVMRTAGVLLVWRVVSLAIFPLVAMNVWAVSVDVFLIDMEARWPLYCRPA
jgi:DHA1 family inner membrane transport protein